MRLGATPCLLSANRIGRRAFVGTAAAALAFPGIARAVADKVRIGCITTLSTPAGYIGEDTRDALLLAINQGNGTLGGVPVELVVADDSLKPAQAKQVADRMMQSGTQILTGIVFSNLLEAVVPGIVAKDGFYISSNAAPATLAGAGCKPNYFSATNQNDLGSGACGLAANELGYKRMVVCAPNYQGGKDSIAGFKRTYKGEIIGEVFTRLDQTDFSVELGQIREFAPDAIYQFHPGGLGINFVKQYGGAGLNKTIPMMLGAYAMDARMLTATGNFAQDMMMSAAWSPLLDVPANKKFVADFRKAYGRIPTVYAAQAYDVALLIAYALKEAGSDLPKNNDKFRDALRHARIDSLRGNFGFTNNQNAMADFWLMKIEPTDDGTLMPKVLKKVVGMIPDPYASACPLPPV